MLKVTINFCGKISLDVEPLERIRIVKEKICVRNGIQPENQRLLFAGTELEDAKTISDYDIVENSRIDLVPLYPKLEVTKNAKQPVRDFVAFHSNCESWMTESFIANGTLIEERDKWKKFSYNVTSDAVQIKKQNKQNETELEELKKCCRDMVEQGAKTLEENKKYREENARLVDENRRLVDENRRLVDENRILVDENRRLVDENASLLERYTKSIEEVKSTLANHLIKCETTIEKLEKLFMEKINI